MTDRRAFLAGTLAVLSAPLAAQDAGRQYRIGVLDTSAEPANMTNMEQLRKGLRELGYVEGTNLRIEYRTAEARNKRYPALAPDAAVAKQADALVVRIGALPEADRRAVVDLAARHRLPAIYAQRQYVDAGGLVSYGISTPDMYYRAAAFADKIFKGAKPSDLPMEHPTKFELVINRKTLKALDLVIPPDLLLRSNEIVG